MFSYSSGALVCVLNTFAVLTLKHPICESKEQNFLQPAAILL